MKPVSISLLALILGASPMFAQADFSLYGAVHISADYVDNGPDTDVLLSSNASRIGAKGAEDLKYGLKALWKLESEVDISGEQGSFALRNRYLGVVSGLGTLVAGYHDTPYRSLGSKAGVMPETIADRRSIIGSTSNGENRFDVRAPKALMYVSPKIAGLEVRYLKSPGVFQEAGVKVNEITSYSGVYRTELFYLGAAFETQSQTPETDLLRVGGGLTTSTSEVNLIYEMFDSSYDKRYDRTGMGLSVSHRISDTILKGQAFFAQNETHTDDTGGALYSVGVSQRLAKQVELYAVVARAESKAQASYVLAAAEHGEVYAPAAPGGNVHAASLGMIYKF